MHSAKSSQLVCVRHSRVVGRVVTSLAHRSLHAAMVFGASSRMRDNKATSPGTALMLFSRRSVPQWVARSQSSLQDFSGGGVASEPAVSVGRVARTGGSSLQPERNESARTVAARSFFTLCIDSGNSEEFPLSVRVP